MSKTNWLSVFEKSLFFLVVIFLPTQLGAHFWPEFTYIYALKIDYLAPVIRFWDLLIIILWLLFILRQTKTRLWQINWFGLNIGLLFLITQLLSLLFIDNWLVATSRLSSYLTALLFGVYIISNQWCLKILRSGLLVSLIVTSTLAILQVIFERSFSLWFLGERSFDIYTPAIAKFNFYGIEILRPYAYFPHPNVLAGFLLISSGLVYLLGGVSQLKKAGIVILVAGFFCFSRVITGLAICVGIYHYLVKKKISPLVLIAAIILLPVIYVRFESIFHYDSLSLTRRNELNEIAITIWQQNPLFGVGLNQFIPTMSLSDAIQFPVRFLQPVHNIYLLQLSETGLIGLSGLFGLIGSVVFGLIRTKDYLYILLWLVVLVIGFFDHYLLTIPQGLRLLILVWAVSFLKVYKI